MSDGKKSEVEKKTQDVVDPEGVDANVYSDKEKPINSKRKLIFLLRSLLRNDVGSIVFFFASCGAVFVIFLYSFALVFDSETKIDHGVEVAKLMMMVAASGLIVSFMTRTNNAVMLSLGFLLIGGLIIPVKDLVGMYLVVTGRSETYASSGYDNAGGGKYGGRASDMAHKIVNEITANGIISNDLSKTTSITKIISNAVYQERVLTSLERIRSRNLLEIIKEISIEQEKNEENSILNWVRRYDDKDNFVSDLEYLKGEGVVSYIYDEYGGLYLTVLGESVVNLSRRQDDENKNSFLGRQQPSAIRDSASIVIGDIDGETCPSGESLEGKLSGQSFDIVINNEPKFVEVTAENEGVYVLKLVSNENDQVLTSSEQLVDPLLIFYRKDDDGTCELIALNDDFGPSLDSQVREYLVSGTYIIEAKSLNATGAARLTMIMEEQ